MDNKRMNVVNWIKTLFRASSNNDVPECIYLTPFLVTYVDGDYVSRNLPLIRSITNRLYQLYEKVIERPHIVGNRMFLQHVNAAFYPRTQEVQIWVQGRKNLQWRGHLSDFLDSKQQIVTGCLLPTPPKQENNHDNS